MREQRIGWALRMENGKLRPAYRNWGEGFPICFYGTRREAKNDGFDGDKPVRVRVVVLAHQMG